MGWVSRFIAAEISPEAVRPFWSEVAVHAVGVTAGILLCAVAGSGLVSVPDLLPVLFFAAIFPPALVRTVARNTIRKAVGLERDVAPWSFKAGFVRFTPDLARNTLPAWQIDETGLYLPGIGDRLGVWAGALVVWIAYGGFWHGLDALVPLLPYLFFVAVIWLVFTLAEAMRWMRLPEPGKTWWSSW